MAEGGKERSMRNHVVPGIVPAILAVLLLVGCGPGIPFVGGSAPALNVVQVRGIGPGVPATATTMGLDATRALGHFDAQKLQVDITRTPDSISAMKAVISGQADYTLIAFSTIVSAYA